MKRAEATQLIVGTRKPVVALRIVRRHDNGKIETELLRREWTDRREKLDKAIKKIFCKGKDKLTLDEWNRLLGSDAPSGGGLPRWALLSRLAINPRDDTDALKPEFQRLTDLFIALPDGTPFCMELLLGETQGGSRKPSGTRKDSQLTFNRLPAAIRVAICKRVKEKNLEVDPLPPGKIVKDFLSVVDALNLNEATISNKQVSDFCTTILKNEKKLKEVGQLDSEKSLVSMIQRRLRQPNNR